MPALIGVVAIFIATAIVNGYIEERGSSFIYKLLFPQKKYKNRLTEIIIEVITNYQQKNRDYLQDSVTFLNQKKSWLSFLNMFSENPNTEFQNLKNACLNRQAL